VDVVSSAVNFYLIYTILRVPVYQRQSLYSRRSAPPFYEVLDRVEDPDYLFWLICCFNLIFDCHKTHIEVPVRDQYFAIRYLVTPHLVPMKGGPIDEYVFTVSQKHVVEKQTRSI